MISGKSAGFGRRFAALVYDTLLLAALLTLYTAAWVFARHGALSAPGAGAWWYVYRAGEAALVGGYYVLNWTHSGQTLGMRAWRLRAVTDTGHALSAAAAMLRFVCGFLAWTPAALGVLWLYLDSEHLALHDRLSKTRVLYLPGP